jgi:apolipoprotein D and lipocalin family protein
MSIRKRRSIMLCLALPFGFSMAAIGQENAVITVSSVDLNRYTGLWYEISKIPNRFQKQCAFGTTAEYIRYYQMEKYR